MSSALLFLASGDSLYVGAMLLILAIIGPSQESSLTPLSILAAWLGVALVVMAAPPFSWTVDALFAFVFLAWFFTRRTKLSGGARLRTVSANAFVVMLLLLTSSELLHRRMPRVEASDSDHLVVIGDSISAGIDSRIPTWPTIFENRTGMVVKNLSQPGAGIADALVQASQVQPQDTLVLLEIGGNDLLSGESSAEFDKGLSSLLAKLSRTGRTLVRTAIASKQDRLRPKPEEVSDPISRLVNPEALLHLCAKRTQRHHRRTAPLRSRRASDGYLSRASSRTRLEACVALGDSCDCVKLNLLVWSGPIQPAFPPPRRPPSHLVSSQRPLAAPNPEF